VVVEHPLGHGFEFLVTQVMGTVEPGAGGDRQPNAIVATREVGRHDVTTPPNRDSTSEGISMMGNGHHRNLGVEHAPELPQSCGADSSDE